MSVKLIFSFDSEDYETPASDDAEKWWAGAMRQAGLPAATCVVGELARALRDRGRQDVLAAMRELEVAYHSDMHSAHPTHAEYLDAMSWDEGLAAVLTREARGLADVTHILGDRPVAYCKPGSSWGPQVAAAMPMLGVPVFCDAPFELAPGRPLWYDNCLFLCYHLSFDRYFDVPREQRLTLMQTDLLRARDRHEGGYLVMYTHPCRLVTSAFPDNFRSGANPPREMWRPAPLRPQDEVTALQEDFEAFLRWVSRDADLELCTYAELYRRHRMEPTPWIRLDELLDICSQLPEKPTYVRAESEWLTPAELFGLVVRAVAQRVRDGRTPDAVPVRRLLGPKHSPCRARNEGALTNEAVGQAAIAADRLCSEGYLPAAVPLGGGEVGPNAFMRTCIDMLTGRRPSLRALPEMPALADRQDIAEMRFQGSWSIFPPEFRGENVLQMARLHTWAAKPA